MSTLCMNIKGLNRFISSVILVKIFRRRSPAGVLLPGGFGHTLVVPQPVVVLVAGFRRTSVGPLT